MPLQAIRCNLKTIIQTYILYLKESVGIAGGDQGKNQMYIELTDVTSCASYANWCYLLIKTE